VIDALRAVCPRCRRLVRPGRCDVDGNEALELADPVQRERMVELSWGTPEHRKTLRRSIEKPLAPRRAFLGTVTFAVSTVVGFFATHETTLALLCGGVVGVIGVLAGAARPLILIPAGAPALPAWPKVGSGKIVHGEELIAPGSGTPCVAWTIELRYAGSWGTRTVFRAGATLGMDIVMDGGDHVRIPAGPFWLDGPLLQLDGEERSIDELLEEIDPSGEDNDWKLFPFNIIMEQHLDEGDRVEVLGVVEPRPVQGEDRLYRDTPTIELVHAGLPVLRRA
jgi:hypothetical protein